MDPVHIASVGWSATTAKVAVVVAVALPLLAGSVPTAAPASRHVTGRQDAPAIVHTAGANEFLLGSALPQGLHPGGTLPVNLTVTNPNSFAIDIQELRVSIARVVAADSSGCGPADFATSQYTGRSLLRVGPAQTTDLRRLGVDQTAWPQVTMIDRPANQDGCKGVTVELGLAGEAIGSP